MYRSAPCLLAHRAFFDGGAGIFKSLHFTYLPDVCLYDDLPIANLEPGVSGRNSLPLTGTWRYGSLGPRAFWAPPIFCIEFCIDFRLDFGAEVPNSASKNKIILDPLCGSLRRGARSQIADPGMQVHIRQLSISNHGIRGKAAEFRALN